MEDKICFYEALSNLIPYNLALEMVIHSRMVSMI